MADFPGYLAPPVPALIELGNDTDVPGYLAPSEPVLLGTPGYPPPAAPVAPPDIEPPQILNFDPAVGSVIGANQAVSFDVIDNSGSFIRIFVVAWFPASGVQEVIHDGDAFVGFYSAGSSRVPITDGFRYTVTKTGGWPSSPTFRVFPIDAAGNEP